MKRAILATAAVAMALIIPSGVAAGTPDTVDPALMQPTLNATFVPGAAGEPALASSAMVSACSRGLQ